MQNVDETDEDKSMRLQLAELCEELGRDVGKRRPDGVDFALVMYRATPAGNTLLAWWSNLAERAQWKAIVRHFLFADDARPRSPWEGGAGNAGSSGAGLSTHPTGRGGGPFAAALENGRTLLRGAGELIGYAGGGAGGSDARRNECSERASIIELMRAIVAERRMQRHRVQPHDPENRQSQDMVVECCLAVERTLDGLISKLEAEERSSGS